MNFRLIPISVCLLILFGFTAPLHAQKAMEDPVLFSIGKDNVRVSEFEYVYEKSNGADADYSAESINEFLELYKKFKLKVADARSRGMENNEQLEAELAQYRNQLADKYLSDDAMLDRLTKELYNRMKWDIDVSHILRMLPPGTPKEVKEAALEKLKEAADALASGVDFSAVAKKYSQDRSVSSNGGHLGYRRAKLPDGFYELETAIYNTAAGEMTYPVYSTLGVHLIKVHGRRPDPGTIEVAHILIRHPNPGEKDTSRQAIERIYEMLQAGGDFNKIAQQYSEDKNNRRQNGYLGKFKTGTYAPAFEDAAFSIPEDGAVSPPVETEFGWHIIKRISLDTLKDYEDEKRFLEEKIRSDDRYQLAQQAFLNRIKKEENFRKMDVSNEELLDVLTKKVFVMNWEVPQEYENRPLFQIRDSIYDLENFINYLAANLDARYQRSVVRDPASEVGHILDQYIDHEMMVFEKAHLEEKYPEFREIMREYREGIMLFEISKEKIWDRAGQDTSGLRSYFDKNRSDFHTAQNIYYNEFIVNTTNSRVLDKVEKLIRKKTPEKVLKKLNKAAEVVTYQSKKVSEGEFQDHFGTGQIKLADHEIYKKANSAAGITIFGQVQRIEPGEPLEFEDARGAVMSDYQKYLEDQWISELQKKYDIKLNESVLRSIIKS
ncbi:peptidylprolyl isomerase [Membranicola marinus]|uniref:Peptidylprolyl isomerase n=1 Tax=Membranihabitans marinus TaxID=1227546 RepID=A0A953HRC2_9BACT|nr:peptidylprolyl isomerase [Membranihabitans marinus]MBY5956975.1 peptidylprolyl isomerase [Membranihabitans marinus]